MSNFNKVFKTKKTIIGMIHFMPLLGYERHKNLSIVLNNAIKDLKSLEKGGVHSVIIENNYDLPHKIVVGPETVASMTFLAIELVKKSKLPIGISVLWNDYRAALSIAKISGCKFIRVPVFVDDVRTSYGDVLGNAKDVMDYRKRIKAEDILIFTDIQVKHSVLLSKKTLTESAEEAIEKGSDALILTGQWTADAPKLNELEMLRKTTGRFPLLIGSGARKDNVKKLLKFADGIIVGTSLKSGKGSIKNVNIKAYSERIKMEKVRDFIDEVVI